MGWMQLAMAVLGIAREIFSYYRKHQKANDECAKKLSEFKKSEDFERMFGDIINK